ncbi:hypothetical protein [Streptomyces sp. GQFP]|uniref:hypothetical protein n=1 Tax=Streptomyces sp. GQFP TaxID=2907545 RepID=UPI001F47C9C1|nr:hypothetical protein [Streptomyces sp. GQFP]UIX32293.1 hypothetical protein LUX31_20845 [Streptomyces sp. GQFP]
MLTERTAAAQTRARTRAPRPSRLLWLSTLLLGLLFSHGLHGESAAGHLDAGVTASLPVAEPESSAGHDHGHQEDGESATAAHNCAPSQPSEALDVPPPSTSPLEVTDPCHLLPRSGIHAVEADPDTRSPSAPSVLRI